MARLKDKPPFLGTRDGICVYTRWGNYYVRTKSSLSGKRVRSAPEFKKTRENASVLSLASRLASAVYRGLEEKNVRLYRRMTGEAMQLLKDGMKEEQVIGHLLRPYSGGSERSESETQVKVESEFQVNVQSATQVNIQSEFPKDRRTEKERTLNREAILNSGPSLRNFIVRPYSPESQPARRQGSPPAPPDRSGGYP